MADEEDQSTDVQDSMTAAEVLAEQRRLEEEALRLALPQQRAEASALEQDYLRGAPPPTTPQEYAQGTVLPTSSGFMYVGNPLQAPAAGTPLAAERALQSATLRQNQPAASEAFHGLVDMGLRRPEEFTPFPRQVPIRAETPSELRFAAQQEALDAISRGIPQDVVNQRYGMFMTGGPKPMSEYQRLSTQMREREIANREAAAVRSAEAAISKPGQALRHQQMIGLGNKIREMEMDIAKNPPVDASDDRSMLLGMWRGELEDLQSQAPTKALETEQTVKKTTPYKVGARYGNLRYKGGDPTKESSWEKVK